MPMRSLPFLPALLALMIGTGAAGAEEQKAATAAQIDSGAYLAAMQAFAFNDFRMAAGWASRVLIEAPDNRVILEKLAISELALGEITSAATAADRAIKAGGPIHLPQIARLAGQAEREDFAAILGNKPDENAIGTLIQGLSAAWAHIGQGSMSGANDALDQLARAPEFASFVRYHRALALASVGDMDGAEAIFSGPSEPPLQLSTRGVIAHVQILSQLERNADALKVLEESFGRVNDPVINDLRRRLSAGEPIPYDIARTPKEGLAEAFFTVAVGLNGQTDDAYVLLFARTAASLRPDNVDAILFSAELMERLGRPELAQEIYGLVPETHPAALSAAIGRAAAMLAGGDKDGSVALLQGLVSAHPDLPAPSFALGDTLRSLDRCAEAVTAYDQALTHFKDPAETGWQVYFNRGSCHEKLGSFDLLVRDMRQALAINPDQPQVLNYLGYSYVDRGENLEEAMAMIEKAVAAEPDAGYIVDSLAWALFRLGRIDEALPHMERASLLEPVDPVVTDHLGDVYWAVGRQREAEFQWHRALSFKPTDKDAARIRRKLEVGLDAVLAEEGAPPLPKTPDAGQNGG